MHIHFRRGLTRLCMILTVAIVAITIKIEYSDHFSPFIRNLDCDNSTFAGGFMASGDLTFDSNVRTAFARGLISQRQACEDVTEYWADGPKKPETAGFAGGSLSVQLPAPDAPKIRNKLQKALATGRSKVPLYRRIDWGPLQFGAYIIAFVWLTYGAGLYIVRAPLDRPRE